MISYHLTRKSVYREVTLHIQFVPMSGFISLIKAASCLNWLTHTHWKAKENLRVLNTNPPFSKSESKIACDESPFKKLL